MTFKYIHNLKVFDFFYTDILQDITSQSLSEI